MAITFILNPQTYQPSLVDIMWLSVWVASSSHFETQSCGWDLWESPRTWTGSLLRTNRTKIYEIAGSATKKKQNDTNTGVLGKKTLVFEKIKETLRFREGKRRQTALHTDGPMTACIHQTLGLGRATPDASTGAGQVKIADPAARAVRTLKHRAPAELKWCIGMHWLGCRSCHADNMPAQKLDDAKQLAMRVALSVLRKVGQHLLPQLVRAQGWCGDWVLPSHAMHSLICQAAHRGRWSTRFPGMMMMMMMMLMLMLMMMMMMMMMMKFSHHNKCLKHNFGGHEVGICLLSGVPQWVWSLLDKLQRAKGSNDRDVRIIFSDVCLSMRSMKNDKTLSFLIYAKHHPSNPTNKNDSKYNMSLEGSGEGTPSDRLRPARDSLRTAPNGSERLSGDRKLQKLKNMKTLKNYYFQIDRGKRATPSKSGAHSLA